MLTASTKLNPRAWDPPSDPPTVLHMMAPLQTLHGGEDARKQWGLEGALGTAGAGQGEAAQDKGQRRYKSGWRRAQLWHSAVLLGLIDPEVFQALSVFIHGDAEELAWSSGPGKSCAGVHEEPMRTSESSD